LFAHDIGFPVRRNRFYGVAIDLSFHVWLGATTSAAQLEEFMYYFGCSTQCEGDVLCGLDYREEHKNYWRTPLLGEDCLAT
jgi:hypothetical protein